MAWGLIITSLYNSIPLRDEFATIGEDHADLPLVFSDSLMVWGTSVPWQVGQQHDIRRSSREQDTISIGIRWYLRGSTLGLHGMDYLVGKLHREWGIVPYHHDSLLIDGVQRAFVTYVWQDGEWSRGIFMLDRMAWDPGIEGSLHIRAMQRS